MTFHTWLVYGLGFILVLALCLTQVDICSQRAAFQCFMSTPCNNITSQGIDQSVKGLQCYGCNIIQGQRYVDVGCSNPEVLTCTHSHKGFKHRFCIKTESTALGIVLTSGCATSRHCQQQELPGVRIHCCASDLCNSAPSWHPSTLHYICPLLSLLLLRMWL